MRTEPEGQQATQAARGHSSLHIVVVGLEDFLAEELARALRESAAADVRIVPRHAAEEWLARWPQGGDAPADAIFCPATAAVYRRIIAARTRPDKPMPVIVVSGCEDYAGWLEALEAGAHDYCVPPFEKRQIGWVLTGLRAAEVAGSAAHERQE